MIDDAIWDDLEVQQSHIRGLDMEASAIGVVGHVWRVPEAIVVKGVMDFAERERARYFRPFAARAAAGVFLAFLRDKLAAQFDHHATALVLSVSRDASELRLWASNVGTHVIRDVEVNAIPNTRGFGPSAPTVRCRGSSNLGRNHRSWFTRSRVGGSMRRFRS